MNPCDPTTLDHFICEASLHLVPLMLRTTNFYIAVLSYLDGKPVTPRNLGAFSFVVRGADPDFYYAINGQTSHFLFRNRGYIATYAAFGGDMTCGANDYNSTMRIRNLLTTTTSYPAPRTLTESTVLRYGNSTPFYDIPLPTAKQFDLEWISEIHEWYVAAGVGVRMTHDTSGRVTAERLSDIINYIKHVDWIGKYLHLPYQIKNVSLVCECSETLLQDMALAIDDITLFEEVRNFGKYFRLLSLQDGMFRQVLALPHDVYPLATPEERQLFVLMSASEDNDAEERARQLNSRRLAALTIAHPDIPVHVASSRSKDIFAIPPDEFCCKVDDGKIAITVVPRTGEPRLDAGHSVRDLVASVVNPHIPSYYQCSLQEAELDSDHAELIYALNHSL